MKIYSSFEEIDKDLKYYRIKSQIHKEEIKLGFLQTQSSLNEIFSPINLLTRILRYFLRRKLLMRILNQLF